MVLLSHKHVIRVADFFESAETLYIVMELCGGGELYEYISNQGKLSEGEVRPLMKQCALAVTPLPLVLIL
jgi:serine/threonine protein kinase